MTKQLKFLSGETWTGLHRNLTMTVAVIITVTVSLSLLGAGLLVRQQVTQMKGFWFDKVEVSVFLCTKNSQESTCTGAVTAEQRDAVAATLTGLQPVVQDVYLETADEAFAHFTDQFAGSPIVESVTPQDLGESFRIKLSDPQQYPVVGQALAGAAGVERVDDQRQVLEKLFRLLDVLQLVAVVIAAAMLAVTVMLVTNTMRLAAHSRRRETAIMSHVGASRAYIQVPFLAEAVVASLAGSALAAGILIATKTQLIDTYLAPNFQFTPFIGWDSVWATIAVVTGAGLGTALLAAWWSLRKHLNV